MASISSKYELVTKFSGLSQLNSAGDSFSVTYGPPCPLNPEKLGAWVKTSVVGVDVDESSVLRQECPALESEVYKVQRHL